MFPHHHAILHPITPPLPPSPSAIPPRPVRRSVASPLSLTCLPLPSSSPKPLLLLPYPHSIVSTTTTLLYSTTIIVTLLLLLYHYYHHTIYYSITRYFYSTATWTLLPVTRRRKTTRRCLPADPLGVATISDRSRSWPTPLKIRGKETTNGRKEKRGGRSDALEVVELVEKERKKQYERKNGHRDFLVLSACHCHYT